MTKAETNLYVDGTNLLAGLVEIFGYKKVPSFSSIVKEINKYHKVNRIYFYASYTPAKNIRSTKIKNQIGLEIKFFKEARGLKNLTFYQGYRSPTSKKEKGVDVHLAVDMVKDAFLEKYQQAIIFSGDADLTYPIEVVINLGLPVSAFFLPNRFSLGIAYKALSPRVLDFKGLFRKYWPTKKIKKLIVVKIRQKRPRIKNAG